MQAYRRTRLAEFIEKIFKIRDDNHPLYKLQTAAASSFDNDMLIAKDIDMTTRQGIADIIFTELNLWLVTYDRKVPNHVIPDAGRVQAVRLAQKYEILDFDPIYN